MFELGLRNAQMAEGVAQICAHEFNPPIRSSLLSSMKGPQVLNSTNDVLNSWENDALRHPGPIIPPRPEEVYDQPMFHLA